MTTAAQIQPTLDALVDLQSRAPIAIVAALARHSHRTRPINVVTIAHHAGLDRSSVTKYLSSPNRHLEPLDAPFRIHGVGDWGRAYHLTTAS